MSDKAQIGPAILSMIIPGLGQLVKGSLFKAVMMWIAVGLSYWFFGWSWILWGVYAFVWLVNVLDAAFSSAENG